MSQEIAQLRREYESEGLVEELMAARPIDEFATWFAEAVEAGIDQPNTFVLATATENGLPSARAVLLKDFSEVGMTFYTGLDSRKSQELTENPYAAGALVWLDLHRQVRFEGPVHRVDDETADAYFETRPRGAQIAAHASRQSHVVDGRFELEDRFQRLDSMWEAETIPRPVHWGGWRIVPDRFEFWQGRPNRFHDRIVYQRDGDGWTIRRLAP